MDNDVKAARIVKGRLERTVLGQVARTIKVVFKPGLRGEAGMGGGGGMPGQAFISIRLDMEAIDSLQVWERVRRVDGFAGT